MFSKLIVWDERKNECLKQRRGVSFEDVLMALAERGPLWIKEHPRPEKYPNQRLLGILIAGYVFIVPFEETDEKIILKTIYPSRKATSAHRKSKRKDHDQSRR
jgi:uncharacterized DUF497 family protein